MNKILMAESITWETKEMPKDEQPIGTKKRERVSPFCGTKLFHLYNVVCMLIVRSNNNGRSRIGINCQHNLPFYNRG
jgi:hypothetical protein